MFNDQDLREQARMIVTTVNHELEEAGMDKSRCHDIATVCSELVLFVNKSTTVLLEARQGVLRCTNVEGLEIDKLDNKVHERFDAVVNNWISETKRLLSGESLLIALAKAERCTDSEISIIEELLSSQADDIPEFARVLNDDFLQDSLKKRGLQTPLLIGSASEYISMTNKVLNDIENAYNDLIKEVVELPSNGEPKFLSAFCSGYVKPLTDKIHTFVEESKKAVSLCRDICKQMQVGGSTNRSNANVELPHKDIPIDGDTFKYEIKRLKEEDDSIRTEISKQYKELHEYVETLFQGARDMSDVAENADRQDKIIRNLNERIEKLEQAQQPPADSSINEKLDVLSRKVKELESKFGNLKKVVYDVINKENSSAVEELGIGNVEEVEFTNSESSSQEDDGKSNRLNDAFADFDKQLADLQEIFNA